VRRGLTPVGPVGPDEGFTLVELLVAMVVMTLVLALSFTVITKIISGTKSSQARSNAIDEARIGVEQMERQIRSGNVLYAPSYDSSNKLWLLQVYTQVNGNQRCVQWKVDTVGQTLQFRSWSPTWQQDGDVTAWRIVARDIVNNPASSPDTPFNRSTSGGVYGTRLLDVHLLVRASGTPGSTALDSSITGRNTSFGYDQAVCTSAIPGG
jgi:prepilin-type N-terminal cleavage/methylation domain-containing protein